LAGEVIVFDKMCHGCYACSELCPQGALPMVPRGIGVVQSRKTGNLVVTEGRINVGEEQAVPMVKAALRHRDPSCTIIDGPPGTACSAQEVLAHSERIILVTEPTPYGLHDLALITELCLKLGKEPLVVVNRSREPFGPMTAFLKETETPLFIPENKDIAHYYSSGEVAWPHVPVLRDVLEQLRERICHE
ncbi:4Fe-4S binding protein, partial [Myxococcota bacterium]|nr:4Fe-4S binding protein [Myxococcota bacterium]